MPTIASSIATTAASRTRPAQRSSERKYGTAMRQIMPRVDMRPDTIILPLRRAGSALGRIAPTLAYKGVTSAADYDRRNLEGAVQSSLRNHKGKLVSVVGG